MKVKKKTIVQELEFEYRDNNTPIERMRRLDSDGDGVSDLIDDGYSKPQDKYTYRELRTDDYYKLKKAGLDVDSCCCKNANKPDSYILRYSEEQSTEIEKILRHTVKRTVSH